MALDCVPDLPVLSESPGGLFCLLFVRRYCACMLLRRYKRAQELRNLNCSGVCERLGRNRAISELRFLYLIHLST